MLLNMLLLTLLGMVAVTSPAAVAMVAVGMAATAAMAAVAMAGTAVMDMVVTAVDTMGTATVAARLTSPCAVMRRAFSLLFS